MELERLERHMYPVKATRPDSQTGMTDNEDPEVSQQSEYLEKIFNMLKEATGKQQPKFSRIISNSILALRR